MVKPWKTLLVILTTSSACQLRVSLFWDSIIQTDRKMQLNRPCIISKDFWKTFIDITVPTDMNVSVKTTQKLSEDKHHEIEISRMWIFKNITIHVGISALWMIKKGWRPSGSRTRNPPNGRNSKDSDYGNCPYLGKILSTYSQIL